MTFVNIVDKTLSKFCGACSDTVSCKVIGTVKIELIITATSAESNVPTKYKTKIGFTNVLFPILCLAIEAIVKKKTKRGAIAFKQLTNNVPNIEINVHVGKKIPNNIPTKIPTTIR